jgi:hypothetical protein
MANLESLKKDSALRQKIQFEMLADKFNKGSNDNSAKLEILLIEFFNSLNNNEVGASEKKLWTRISKALDALSSELP